MNFPRPAWNPRYLKPLVLAGLTLVAYAAAINRGQALPWAIAALLLATLITGFVWPRWLVKRLSVTRSGPERAEEGETILFHVTVRNHGWLPRFMVEAMDRLPFVGAARGDAPEEKVLGVVAYIGGDATRSFDVPLLCEKRGFYRLGPVGLASSFPLGLIEAREQKSGGVQTLTIYPDVFPIVSLPLSGTPSEIHRGGFLLPEGAGAAEFSGLREYRRGDNPRHVHWPTTARLNELMVKEFEPLASASLYIALDMSAGGNAGKGKHSSFEYAVRIAASIGRYACSNGMPVRLHGEGARQLAVGIGSGEAHYRDMLDALAVAAADGAIPYAKALQNVAMNCRHGQTVVVFLAEPQERVAGTLQAVALLRARGAYVLAIAFERETFLDKEPGASSPWAGLLDLGVGYLTLRKGDDLVRVFNP
ncbi:DUF58 domain-containing protein [Candidatus Ferrigenium straubiae]|jgi:uncharacterized protein (DUF58 family)|uniref:DUF58 domain-containing protein n=1 Tax=Candidatus Ferrigenium straubiae TaxID=2919506 RepID=UPI003F4AB22C